MVICTLLSPARLQILVQNGKPSVQMITDYSPIRKYLVSAQYVQSTLFHIWKKKKISENQRLVSRLMELQSAGDKRSVITGKAMLSSALCSGKLGQPVTWSLDALTINKANIEL